jgi:hypothetical protein
VVVAVEAEGVAEAPPGVTRGVAPVAPVAVARAGRAAARLLTVATPGASLAPSPHTLPRGSAGGTVAARMLVCV